jgi:hypothetical protein
MNRRSLSSGGAVGGSLTDDDTHRQKRLPRGNTKEPGGTASAARRWSGRDALEPRQRKRGPTRQKTRRSDGMPEYRQTANHDTEVIETPTEARAGVTGHNVRYVLMFGTVGVIVLFAIIYLLFF